MRKYFLILLSIAAATAGDKDKDKGKFEPGPASSYTNRQTQDKVTVAAEPYIADSQVRAAFGKVDPNRYGILPVLVVIQNDSGQALKIDLKAEYVEATGNHVEATPSKDVQYLQGAREPHVAGPPSTPIPLPKRNKKGPLAEWEIDGRGFAVKMLPAGEAAHGFVYFQSAWRPGSKVVISGLRDASSNKELFFFEIPLNVQGVK